MTLRPVFHLMYATMPAASTMTTVTPTTTPDIVGANDVPSPSSVFESGSSGSPGVMDAIGAVGESKCMPAPLRVHPHVQVTPGEMM